jgi:DNA-binding transcriptional LysR family regulator
LTRKSAPLFHRRGGPRDLERHACLGYTYLATGERWHFTNAEGVEEAVTVRGPLSATNAEALEGALLAGIGIALQPDFLAWEALRAGRLVAVLVGWNPTAGCAQGSDAAGPPARLPRRRPAGFPDTPLRGGLGAMDGRSADSGSMMGLRGTEYGPARP